MFPKLAATLLVFLLTVFSASSPSYARVVGIKVPATIHPGTPFPATILTESYIQNVYDYYMVFGMAPRNSAAGGLNELLGLGVDLVAINEYNTAHGAFNVSLTIPSNYNPDEGGEKVNLRASVFSTTGASQETWVSNWDTNVTVVAA
ncbi:hypothetical protein DL93DRAFT_2230090 [Clavulina sp. PMI_390]|nr:hypothetical protein DL93DRAFT_2230090 [Clavulina sp. PMI_390]